VEITHIGKLLNIPSICVSEDDFDVTPQFSKLAYPFATAILAPAVCKTGKWIKKTISYEGYHELAYLHPDNFIPDKNVVRKYFNPDETYFILRFSKLNAYHDTGIQGITDDFATGLIELLKSHGRIFITSEREYADKFNQFRINIDPIDMHHVMAFAKLYIGDSQTMAAEAGVLGVPFIRINDFVGRIGYLNELEGDFKLGFGFKPEQINAVYSKVSELLTQPDLRDVWKERRQRMLSSKINVEKFMTWLFENFPESLYKTSYQGKKISRKNGF
jgi:predicted glycosyltransferase